MSTPNNICEGPLAFAAYVGLDWGDEQHAVSLCTAGADRIERTTLNHTPEALTAWANGLRTRFGDGKIAVCLEQARGPLLYALLQYEHLVLYPINPKSLARFREALHPSHAKDDPVDADLALDMVHKHRRSEEHTSELQSRLHLVCRLLLEKKKQKTCNAYKHITHQRARPRSS